MFAHAVVHLATIGSRSGGGGLAGELGARVAGQVSGASNQSGNAIERRVERLLDRHSRRDLFALLERWQRGIPALNSAARPQRVPERLVDVAGIEAVLPLVADQRAASGTVRAVRLDKISWRPEWLVGNAHHGFGASHLFGGEWVAMRFVTIDLIGTGRGDVAAQDQQARAIGDRDRIVQRDLKSVAIVGDLTEVLDMPAVRLEPQTNVVAIGERGIAIDGDVVVVVDADQVAEALVPGQRSGFVTDAFHEATVASNHEGAVVHHVGPEPAAQVTFG